jgi:hypothetical protein
MMMPFEFVRSDHAHLVSPPDPQAGPAYRVASIGEQRAPEAELNGRAEGRQSWDQLVAWAFTLACFFPYPALAIGGNTGLQLSQFLSLASAPLLCGRAVCRPLCALILLLTPIFVSGFVNILFGLVPSVGILPKASAALVLALGVIWPSGWIVRRSRFRAVLAAAVVGIAVHAAIGLLQVYAFSHDEFPLLWLYRNPSFKSMGSWSELYARYIKRPCGLFPEPSAMGASLGPWLVLLSGLLLDPRLGRGLGWRAGSMATCVLAAGFTLLALSRSGSAFTTMGAVFVVWAGSTLFGHGRGEARSGFGRYLVSALVFTGVVTVLVYAAYRLSQGFGERVDSSWGVRALTIWGGLTANVDPIGLLFGVGPGQSTDVLRRNLAWVPLAGDQEELAVFSLVVAYYMDTGLLGLMSMIALLAMMLFAVARSSAIVLGLCALGTWLVGTVVTTSYIALSPIWLFLAVLLTWDQVFPTPARPAFEQRIHQ